MMRLPIPILLLLLLLLVVGGVSGSGSGSTPPVRGAVYNESLAKLGAVWSSIAYGPPEDVAAGVIYNDSCRALLPTFRIVRAYHSKARDAFGYIGVSDAERLVVAAFKGSNETEDFITDAEGPFRYRFSCAPDDGGDVSLGKTHHGFCVYYKSLVSLGMTRDLVALWKAHRHYGLLVTGHSLGGAAATLCAADLGLRFGLRPLLYTYGEPRVGDVAFAAALPFVTAGAFRVVHRSDCVPHLPPCCDGLLAGQCRPRQLCPYHHGEEIWYADEMPSLLPTDTPAGDTQLFVSCPGDEDEAACSNGSVTSVPDHKIYFGQHIGAWCGYPPGTFPPPTRPAWASESERGGEGAAAGLRGTAVA